MWILRLAWGFEVARFRLMIYVRSIALWIPGQFWKCRSSLRSDLVRLALAKRVRDLPVRPLQGWDFAREWPTHPRPLDVSGLAPRGTSGVVRRTGGGFRWLGSGEYSHGGRHQRRVGVLPVRVQQLVGRELLKKCVGWA